MMSGKVYENSVPVTTICNRLN